MRKIIQFFSVFFFVFLVACGGGGGSSGGDPLKPTLITTAGESVILPVGTSGVYEVTGGVPPYRVGNSDRVIAVGVISGNTLTIGAVTAGNTKINIFDNSGASIGIDVVVGSSTKLFTTAPESLTIGVGTVASRTFKIGGGAAPYSVESSASNVATVIKVGEDQFLLTGIAIGTSIIKIRDAAGAELGIALTVGAPELRISPDDVTTFPGIKVFAKISGGQPPYQTAGGIPAAISAVVNGDILEIMGNLASELELSVADATGQTVKIKVKVEIGQPTFGFSPKALSVSENDSQPINLTLFGAAAGEVCLFTSDSAYLQPAGPSCTSSRNITVDTGTRGSRCVDGDRTVTITAVDSARAIGTAAILILDNGDACEGGPAALTVTPGALTVTSGATPTSNDAVVRGGSGTYAVTSSNPAAATGAIAGNILTVTGGTTAGAVVITVRDLADPSKEATVAVTVN